MSKYALVNGEDIHDDPRCEDDGQGCCLWDGEEIREKEFFLRVTGEFQFNLTPEHLLALASDPESMTWEKIGPQVAAWIAETGMDAFQVEKVEVDSE